ncbi:RHS repeat-associated core domain-containing protein [Pseudomonas fragariae (ex Marin et al. 2024)]|uniref:RHS repeat protein n=2 Tax=Pseudomonas fragariae (ex Marin et al. 2024) TaxID=3080056 RepID=A0ABT3LK55_9PSED|nr:MULTISPECIES: RHS repeat-associated core domain-containing protein [unclassified Pseudomonas]MCW6056842.1 RHS repeat protein [Pseudomonas fragi]MDV0426923.1 RHS repeat-associated core domain-containing protein [Pseudomonas sp. 17]MDX9572896.1 RHS repeat-associated core domain-containing protein [Pseudomonas sp. 21(2023)]MDX9587803.1 RHS repeat-associated core domain-containing protein [Pseudomonas sp. 19(2023)]MDX9624769.1 RHS repeat-associated core domain-containing protein [Pseudomonas sp
MNSIMHTNTPQLAVSDSRALPVRSVQFYRGADDQPVEARVTQQYFDKAGRLIASRDPRFASRLKYGVCAPVNLMQIVSLSGALLLSKSVDSGWRVSLNGEAGQLVDSWDGRDNPRQIEYDALLRPLAINESGRMTERFTYGGPATAERNQCNQLIRHDDTAGSRLLPDYGLSGGVLSEERCFLQSPDRPDWPLAEPDRDALLEPVGLQTRRAFNAQGEALAQTDANGNVQRFSYGAAGQLHAVELTLTNTEQPQTLVSAIDYDAFNQVEQETAGNGVVSRYVYDLQDGRLIELSALSADGSVLQKLNYSYDPAGNVLLINDASQPDRYCGNQRIEPINRYCYDTLYQLIEATGREVRNGASHGPALPGLQPLPTLDPCQVSNYRQHYSYDRAGNLLQMRHEGAHNFTRNMHVAPDSNRSLPDDDEDVDFATSFDANGNLLQLVRGQVMGWDVRNQLQHIITVQREDGANDDERYVYDGQGQRCRKISTAQASGRTLSNEVRYLPGLEIRTTADGEILHVITAQAGRNSVRVLHWEAGKPDGIANDQVRYSLGDHLGSSTLELDQQGGLISQESYYPFGGTAWWAARSAVDARYKTVRYSGKERDASGLYYYGFRYYAPWLQRWINPDPAGAVDGLNLYTMVRNNPAACVDPSGLAGDYRGRRDSVERDVLFDTSILARGRSEISRLPDTESNYLDKAFKLAHLAFDESSTILAAPALADMPETLVSYVLGDSIKERLGEVVETYTATAAMLKEYDEGGEQYNQIAVMKNYPGTDAFIDLEDQHKRIFIVEDFLARHVAGTSITLGHEVSHIVRDNEILDFGYLAPGLRDEKDAAISEERYLTHLEGGLQSALEYSYGHKNPHMFRSVERMMQKNVLGAERAMGLFKVKSMQDLKVERLSDPEVRTNLLMNNADSLAMLSFMLAESAVKGRLRSWGALI